MHLYNVFLYAKFQGNRIWHSRFMAAFLSVQKDEEKIMKKKNKETEPIFEVTYLGKP